MMTLFDLLLVTTLIGLGAAAVLSRDLFRSVILLMVFGLVMGLAWARLNAPDIALTEAALGAGMTGALLLNALRIFSGGENPRVRSALLVLPGLALVALATVLIKAVRAMTPAETGLGGHIEAAMPASGVEHPLTAVLLNFRGYDTLLEIGVLVLAVIAVWSLDQRRSRPFRLRPPQHDNPVLRAGISLLIPVMVIAAGYMVWAGAFRPGGAFQAGALLGAGSVTLIASGMLGTPLSRHGLARALLAGGFVFFLAVAAGTVLFKGHLLEYPPELAGGLIMAIESLLALSIGGALAALFAGVAGVTPAGKDKS